MADAITVSGPVSGTDKTLTFSTGRLAPQSQGAVDGRDRRHPGAGHRQRRRRHPRGHRLLPPHRRRRGEDVRRRQDPRLVLPPGGPSHRPGRPGLPPDRPAAATQLRRGLPQRDPGRGHRPRRRPGEPPRRDRHQRRVGGADAVGPAVRGPDRRRAPGLQPATAVDPAPHLPGAARTPPSRSWSPAARRRRRHRHHDGRGRRHREGVGLLRGRRPEGHRGGHRRRARGVPRPGSTSRSTCSSELVDEGRRRTPRSRWDPSLDYSDEVDAAVEAADNGRLVQANTDRRQDRAQRRQRRGQGRAIVAELCGEGAALRRPREAGQGRHPGRSPRSVIRARVVDEGVRIDGRGPTDLRPCQPRWACSPPPTAPVCSSGARPRCSTCSPSACPAWTSCSTPSGSTTKKRYMHHYNMPPYANGETGRMGGTKRREVGHGLLAERALLPVVPSARGVALRPAPRVRGAVVQRLHLDGVGLLVAACR